MGILSKLFDGPGFFESRRLFAVSVAAAKERIAEYKANERETDSEPPEARDSGDDYDSPPDSVSMHHY